jgi:hypothetical protein
MVGKDVTESDRRIVDQLMLVHRMGGAVESGRFLQSREHALLEILTRRMMDLGCWLV